MSGSFHATSAEPTNCGVHPPITNLNNFPSQYLAIDSIHHILQEQNEGGFGHGDALEANFTKNSSAGFAEMLLKLPESASHLGVHWLRPYGISHGEESQGKDTS